MPRRVSAPVPIGVPSHSIVRRIDGVETEASPSRWIVPLSMARPENDALSGVEAMANRAGRRPAAHQLQRRGEQAGELHRLAPPHHLAASRCRCADARPVDVEVDFRHLLARVGGEIVVEQRSVGHHEMADLQVERDCQRVVRCRRRRHRPRRDPRCPRASSSAAPGCRPRGGWSGWSIGIRRTRPARKAAAAAADGYRAAAPESPRRRPWRRDWRSTARRPRSRHAGRSKASLRPKA